MTKRILFLTGTRADFGKLKSLMHSVEKHPNFEMHTFITGMHMIQKFGYTCREVEKEGFDHIYKYINHNNHDSMDVILAKTIMGLSDYIKEMKPDLLVVHGDRVEALAGAIVGSLNNILVAHIEGGEVSGTIDELIRHSVTKMAHTHFVANERAKQRLLQLGEIASSIKIIGSPDLDIMVSEQLPSLQEAKARYEIEFDDYAIVLFHPVTTEFDKINQQVSILVDTLIESQKNYVIVFPNNDLGSEEIIQAFDQLSHLPSIKVFPSIRFEYFLILMKHAEFMIGNSSAGVRECPFYGVPSINIGSRQNNRSNAPSIQNVDFDKSSLIESISNVHHFRKPYTEEFGDGKSNELFLQEILGDELWKVDKQKVFVDL